jgi:hypothetical protein
MDWGLVMLVVVAVPLAAWPMVTEHKLGVWRFDHPVSNLDWDEAQCHGRAAAECAPVAPPSSNSTSAPAPTGHAA